MSSPNILFEGVGNRKIIIPNAVGVAVVVVVAILVMVITIS